MESRISPFLENLGYSNLPALVSSQGLNGKNACVSSACLHNRLPVEVEEVAVHPYLGIVHVAQHVPVDA